MRVWYNIKIRGGSVMRDNNDIQSASQLPAAIITYHYNNGICNKKLEAQKASSPHINWKNSIRITSILILESSQSFVNLIVSSASKPYLLIISFTILSLQLVIFVTSLSFDNTSITWFRFFVNTFYTKSARNILALASSSKEVAQKDTS